MCSLACTSSATWVRGSFAQLSFLSQTGAEPVRQTNLEGSSIGLMSHARPFHGVHQWVLQIACVFGTPAQPSMCFNFSIQASRPQQRLTCLRNLPRGKPSFTRLCHPKALNRFLEKVCLSRSAAKVRPKRRPRRAKKKPWEVAIAVLSG